jgi:hypothetical protein
MKAKALPSQEELLAAFDYSPITGELSWKISPNRSTKVGDVAGAPTPRGYKRLTFKHQQYFNHRLIWMMVTGTDPVEEIDHIDRDPANNAWHNLREVSSSLNSHNTRKKVGSVKKNGEKFEAAISIRNDKTYLGMFESEEIARLACRMYRSKVL